MTNLEAYVLEMEKTGSSPCYVPTKTLRMLLDVAEAAWKEHGRKCSGEFCGICDSLKKLDEARRG